LEGLGFVNDGTFLEYKNVIEDDLNKAIEVIDKNIS